MTVGRGVGAVAPVTAAFPVGSIGDQFFTCVQAGGSNEDCAAAVVQTNPMAGAPSTLPSWAIPAAIGGFVFLLFLGMGGRR